MKTPGAARRPVRPLVPTGTRRLGTGGSRRRAGRRSSSAAVAEFAELGIAGARTDAIARAAHVNKALLYYYFKDKDALYEAVLDHVFSGLRARVMPVLESKLPPRQKMLEYLGAYFDYIAANPRIPRLVQAEWMRAGAKARLTCSGWQGIFSPDLREAGRGVAGGDWGGGISGGESDGFSAFGGGGGCVLFQRGAADENTDEGGSVVGGADSGAAGLCTGFYFDGAVQVITAETRSAPRKALGY